MTFWSVPVPTFPCLRCGHQLNAVANVTGDPPRGPRAGDFNMCVNCGALMVFGEDLQLELPTQADLQRAESRPDIVQARSWLLQAIELRRHRKKR